MKTYTLIKTYPGFKTLGYRINCQNGNSYYSENPEFWEEVVELDYEILSYVKKDNPKCHTLKRRGGERHDEFWNIRVVKRLSDGEIFKIGDVIQTYKNSPKHRIVAITIAKGQDSLKQGIWITYDGGSQQFSNTIKVKDKLFTTEDGVDIYMDDSFWFIERDDNRIFNVDAISSSGKNRFIKYFSTEEAAQKYLINNKVCLSLDDIRRSLSLTSNQLNDLVTLIKIKTIT
jgi:hypothetical protein